MTEQEKIDAIIALSKVIEVNNQSIQYLTKKSYLISEDVINLANEKIMEIIKKIGS